MAIEQQAVVLRHEDRTTDGTLSIRVYASGERVKRAVGGLAACWALAGVTLFIPIAHFVLVPGFAIAGPVVAMRLYAQDQAMLHVKGECPKCGEAITIELDAKDKLPLWSYCPKCQAYVHIDKR